MKKKLCLCLASDHIQVTALHPRRSVGALARYVFGLPQSDSEAFEMAWSIRCVAALEQQNAPSILADLFEQIAKRCGSHFSKYDIEVEVGPGYSKIGVMELDAGHAMSASELVAHCSAWALQRWAIAPSKAIINSTPLPSDGPSRHLVSCIDSFVYEGVLALCQKHKLAFTVCSPALAAVFEKQNESEMDGTRMVAVFELDHMGQNTNQVQFLTFFREKNSSVMHMWLSDANSKDELEFVTRRIAHTLKLDPIPKVVTSAWPLPKGSTS